MQYPVLTECLSTTGRVGIISCCPCYGRSVVAHKVSATAADAADVKDEHKEDGLCSTLTHSPHVTDHAHLGQIQTKRPPKIKPTSLCHNLLYVRVRMLRIYIYRPIYFSTSLHTKNSTSLIFRCILCAAVRRTKD